MKKLLLHIVQETNIINDFKDFNETEFSEFDHQYLCFEKSSIISIIKTINASNNIHIHGLFDRWLPLILLFLKRDKSIFWYLWGGDVYNDILKASWKHNIYNILVKRIFIKKIVTSLVTYLPGDAEFVRTHYGFKGNVIKNNLYLSNTISDEINPLDKGIEEKQILLGNSSVPENNHILGINAISKNSILSSYEIIMPMSYGDSVYLKSVEEHCDSSPLRIKILKEFMSLSEYRNILSRVSVCIFYHEYQMAMGNIIFLIYCEKLVFLNPKTSPYKFFIENGIFVLTLDDINNFNGLSTYRSKLAMNKKLIANLFSREMLVIQYKELYNL